MTTNTWLLTCHPNSRERETPWCHVRSKLTLKWLKQACKETCGRAISCRCCKVLRIMVRCWQGTPVNRVWVLRKWTSVGCMTVSIIFQEIHGHFSYPINTRLSVSKMLRVGRRTGTLASTSLSKTLHFQPILRAKTKSHVLMIEDFRCHKECPAWDTLRHELLL